MTKANAVSFDLKVDPKKADSASYKQMVHVPEGNKTICQLLRWQQDVSKVLVGLNATNASEQLNVLSALMRPSPAAMFNAEMEELTRI